jgi:hypothetical protein
MELLQVVPTLLPDEGVGTHATLLGGALRRRFGIESRFLVGDPAWSGAGTAAGMPAFPLPERTAGALRDSLTSATVLVHYVNYAYQRRGCPAWLVRGLTRWRREGAGRRLVTIFHEVYANGLPWQSSFWLSPVQRWLARELVAWSDAAVTSLDLYIRRLGGARVAGKVEVWPVFSNLGEPADPPPYRSREPRLAVFGGPGTRRRAYAEWGEALAACCRELAIEEIWDIGPPADRSAVPAVVAGIPVQRHGALPAATVSDLLLRCRAGFLAYPAGFLTKSGIFAAYCAHGLLPVCAGAAPEPPRDTPAGKICWRPGTDRDPQAIARAARTWYEGHSLDRQTEMFRRLVSS